MSAVNKVNNISLLVRKIVSNIYSKLCKKLYKTIFPTFKPPVRFRARHYSTIQKKDHGPSTTPYIVTRFDLHFPRNISDK